MSESCDEFNAWMEPLKMEHRRAMRQLKSMTPMCDQNPFKQFGPEPATNLLYESMTKIRWGSFTIRVWRQLESLDERMRDVDIYIVLNSIDPVAGRPEDIHGKLLSCARVNAVEVLDAAGNGTIVYRDWP